MGVDQCNCKPESKVRTYIPKRVTTATCPSWTTINPLAIHKPTMAISNARKILGEPLGRRGRDRKSTRLNSSHVAISYAVFCLKKKKRRRCQAPRAKK